MTLKTTNFFRILLYEGRLIPNESRSQVSTTIANPAVFGQELVVRNAGYYWCLRLISQGEVMLRSQILLILSIEHLSNRQRTFPNISLSFLTATF